MKQMPSKKYSFEQLRTWMHRERSAGMEMIYHLYNKVYLGTFGGIEAATLIRTAMKGRTFNTEVVKRQIKHIDKVSREKGYYIPEELIIFDGITAGVLTRPATVYLEKFHREIRPLSLLVSEGYAKYRKNHEFTDQLSWWCDTKNIKTVFNFSRTDDKDK